MRGRPKKEGKENNVVSMYVKSPLALLIHKKLAKQGLASDKYERFLLENYSPLLSVEEKIAVLHAEQHRLIAEHSERRQEMAKEYAFRIEKLDWHIQELKRKQAIAQADMVLEEANVRV